MIKMIDALTEIESLQPQQLSQALHLSLEVVDKTRVRVFIHDRFTHDLLGAVGISTHVHSLNDPLTYDLAVTRPRYTVRHGRLLTSFLLMTNSWLTTRHKTSHFGDVQFQQISWLSTEKLKQIQQKRTCIRNKIYHNTKWTHHKN